MTDPIGLIYLETDDEVTSVVRRIRSTDAERIVIVVPGRSRATSSAVAMRLLARTAAEGSRRLAVVGDTLTRSLAAEAGIEAWATVDEARAGAPIPEEPRAARAPIRVVRGEPAPEMPSVVPPVAPTVDSVSAGPNDETRPVAVPVPGPTRPTVPSAPERARVALPPLAIIVGLLVLMLGAGVVGAAVLPAATVTIAPAAVPLGPLSYEVRVGDPQRLSGTAEATAGVVATGTYPILAPSTGTVVFRNFNTVGVAVGAGTLVAAGEQAFETAADIVVPAGTLTAEGTIRAGEEAVGVSASAAGPGANVAAEAIDTILSQNVAARLRGFPNNSSRLVVNPEPTAGGIDDVGPEITQEDVDRARAALVAELEASVADALASSSDAISADAGGDGEPTIEGLDGLVGTRDTESVEITGSVAYDRLAVDRDRVVELAAEMLIADTAAVPPDHELIESSIRVSPGAATRDGDALVISVQVAASTAPVVDREAIVERVRGLSLEEARAALASMGDASVELWPGWVERVPELDWRITVTIDGELAPSSSPAPS